MRTKERTAMQEMVLQVRDLKTYFYTEEGTVPAVDVSAADFDQE